MKREFKPTHPKRGLSDKAVQFLPACAAIAMFFAVGDGRAVEPDYQVIQVTVMLDDALIIGRPWHHGTQALVEVEPGGPTNFISLTGNETVLGVYPARPIGEPGMSDAGPWVIRVGTTSDPEPVRSQVEATLPVRTSKLPNLQEPEVNGEASKAWFPNETMPGRVGGFSQYQVHLHFPDPNELPTPTLRDGGLDQGAWFFDGQTAGDTLSSGIEFATDEWLETWMPADMDLPQAWAITRGSPDVVIAVLDPHGVDWQHPDLSGLQAPDNSLPVEDAILSLVGGNIWRNDRDLPGIQSAPGGDEDNDGKIDEDFFNQEPGELPELASVGMPAGSATGTGTYSIEFSGVSWTPGEWAGDTLFFLSRSDVPGSPLGETRFAVAVDSNSTSTLWTGCPIANVVAWEAQNGWVYYESWVSNYSAWLVNSSEADHIDNDGDGNVDEASASSFL